MESICLPGSYYHNKFVTPEHGRAISDRRKYGIIDKKLTQFPSKNYHREVALSEKTVVGTVLLELKADSLENLLFPGSVHLRVEWHRTTPIRSRKYSRHILCPGPSRAFARNKCHEIQKCGLFSTR